MLSKCSAVRPIKWLNFCVDRSVTNYIKIAFFDLWLVVFSMLMANAEKSLENTKNGLFGQTTYSATVKQLWVPKIL